MDEYINFLTEINLVTDKIKSITTKYIQSQHDIAEKDATITRLANELDTLKQEHINYNKVSMLRQQDKMVQTLQSENTHLKKQLAQLAQHKHSQPSAQPPPEIQLAIEQADTKIPATRQPKHKKKTKPPPLESSTIIPTPVTPADPTQLPLSQMELIKCNGIQYWEFDNNLYEFIDYDTVGQFIRKYI